VTFSIDFLNLYTYILYTKHLRKFNNFLYFISAANGCQIESSNKASKKCRKRRQQELAITRKDYQLAQDQNRLAYLNKNRTEVYSILQRDALDHDWIKLYNSTIFKNLGLFFKFNKSEDQEDDYTKIYNFFIANQLTRVSQVNSF